MGLGESVPVREAICPTLRVNFMGSLLTFCPLSQHAHRFIEATGLFSFLSRHFSESTCPKLSLPLCNLSFSLSVAGLFEDNTKKGPGKPKRHYGSHTFSGAWKMHQDGEATGKKDKHQDSPRTFASRRCLQGGLSFGPHCGRIAGMWHSLGIKFHTL